MRERTILMGGFSKAYAMTGWRVGWLAAPAAILEGIVKVHQYGIMSAPTTAQDAALEALRQRRGGRRADGRRVRPPPAARRRRAQRDRPADVRAARRLLRVPGGHDGDGLSSEAFAQGLLEEERVAVIPGIGVRAVRRGPRPGLLRDELRAARGGARPDRPVRRPPSCGRRRVTTPTARPRVGRARALRAGHRHRGPLPAQDRLEDVLLLLDGLRRRAAEHPRLPGLPRPARAPCPTINRAAVEHVLATGIAIEASSPEKTRWERKNYFYPDLPKGYQISQYELPLTANGRLTFDTSEGPVTIGITRAHLEEDTAKLIHATAADGRRVSLVDFNRSGAPLMEIVTDPDVRSAEQARRYAEELQLLLRAIGASDADMERGQMRVEANVSLRPRGTERVRDAGRGQEHELVPLGRAGDRVRDRAPGGGARRRRDADPGHPRLGRGSRRDVRDAVEGGLARLPLLPGAGPAAAPRRRRLARRDPDAAAGAAGGSAGALPGGVRAVRLRRRRCSSASRRRPRCSSASLATGSRSVEPKAAANWVTGAWLALPEDRPRCRRPRRRHRSSPTCCERVAGGDLSRTNAKEVFAEHAATGESVAAIVDAKGFLQISDDGRARAAIVDEVIAANPKAVEDYRAGKPVIGFFVGQVMKATRGQANAARRPGGGPASASTEGPA